MPIVSTQTLMVYSTVRIVAHTSAGTALGTGFQFAFRIEGKTVPFLITNRHVLEDAHEVEFYLHTIDSEAKIIPEGQQRMKQENAQNLVVYHPDPEVDVAAIPLGQMFHILKENGRQPLSVQIDSNLFADPEDPKWQDEILPVQMVGYPNGLMDEVNNIPIVRNGYTATPYKFRYNGKSEFMVDIACFPGSSGSPIFSHTRGTIVNLDGSYGVGEKTSLLGLLYAGPIYNKSGEIIRKPVPTNSYAVNIGDMMHLGYCIRASEIMALLPQIKAKFRL
ncbi:trypsin-like peptidase domain-containing protein [Stappia sp. BW2]|uniref:S1 family peptidase n=1 Tax=Stappia sp. BW2 TaxID=2592622 RepID=UPI0011DEB50E|nr:serine protease [Stappia sp. BW2]TYC65656.1 trypsin-like peptidase domain-containing protein [Stappia sp. BW2]